MDPKSIILTLIIASLVFVWMAHKAYKQDHPKNQGSFKNFLADIKDLIF